MTAEEATRVIEAMKQGRSFTFSDYMSGTRTTHSFDAGRGLFVRREQSMNGDDDLITCQESEFLASLLAYFAYSADLRTQLGLG
jgi:hypothetical protein